MNVDFNNGKIFCTKCGSVNKVGYRFCVKCGAKLIAPVPRPQPEDVEETMVIEWDQPAETSEQASPVEEAVKPEPVMAEPEPEAQTFGAFEQAAPVEEAVKPEPVMAEPEPEAQAFGAFEQAAPVEEAVKPEPVMAEPEPEAQAFGAFEEASPVEEPVKEEPAQTAGFAGTEEAAFEPEPIRQTNGFARSEFTGSVTPTVAAGAFATAVDAVRNNKQIDVSDAETVMSLLEQDESSALAKGLPAWDIVPPQVVVRRKHRV